MHCLPADEFLLTNSARWPVCLNAECPGALGPGGFQPLILKATFKVKGNYGPENPRFFWTCPFGKKGGTDSSARCNRSFEWHQQGDPFYQVCIVARPMTVLCGL